jgi:3-oxoacyl-[acyl-carrier-protein] synthase-3
MATEAGCNAIQMQLAIAQPMIALGARKYALLVQCCNVTPLARPEEPLSCWFGDGCTAVILGPVREGRGILSHAHRTRGQFHQAIVASVPGGNWYDDGRVQMYSGDHHAARESFLNIADYGTEVVDETLAAAGHRPEDIAFYAAHQPTRWFREVTQNHLGLVNARFVETFHFTGSMFGANIPFGLDLAQKDGLVKADDLVLMYAGGAGLTYSSTLLRWGR